MSKKKVLRLIFFIISIPHYLIAYLAYLLLRKQLGNDLKNCIVCVKGTPLQSSLLVKALIVSEDHRSKLHFGVDYISIARALLRFLAYKEIQGASTIEQQFVRVVTGRYERTLWRKTREQWLALLLCFHCDKQEIASAYLSIAYYGVDSVGVDAIQSYTKSLGRKMSFVDALGFVSCLKYPKPNFASSCWEAIIGLRVSALRANVSLSSYLE